jgi:hypothetical protein
MELKAAKDERFFDGELPFLGKRSESCFAEL